jgi:transcriptional antiterminator NusG
MTTENSKSTAKKRWYVIQAFSGYELRVRETLLQSIEQNEEMKELIDEVLVPMERVKEYRDGKKRESQRKFFPGYVLIHMVMNEKTWLFVRHTDRVLGFVGGNIEHPMPITDAEAERILGRLKETENTPTQKTKFEVGERVRAKEGAFKDFTGIVEAVDYEKSRVTVSISIFGRDTPVDLDFAQVEKDV